MRRRLIDRRNQPRFEIVGELWGSVETVLRLPLRDLGLNGALVESHIPVPVDSTHRIAWEEGGVDGSVQVRVRHVQRVTGADGEETYRLGVEFLSRTPLLAEQIQRWMCAVQAQPETPGL